MSMEQPTFDPRDEKYKKVADLPEDQQKNFADIKGGFITKEADEYSDKFRSDVARRNPETLGGKIINKLKGVDKKSLADRVFEHEIEDSEHYYDYKVQHIADPFVREQKRKEELQKIYNESNEKISILDAAKTGNPDKFHYVLKRENKVPTKEELETFGKNYINYMERFVIGQEPKEEK